MAIVMKVFEGNREKVIAKAARILGNGGSVIFPTESSYGLGADASNPIAVKKVWAIKQQPPTKQISIIAADLQQAQKYGKMAEEAKKLAEEFMPGPLTLVVEKQPSVPSELSERTVAFRISSNRLASELCRQLGSPITATSANMHGRPSIYSAREVIKQFNNRVNMIIDAGELQHNQASTIYDVAEKRVLRLGPVTEQQIKVALGE